MSFYINCPVEFSLETTDEGREQARQVSKALLFVEGVHVDRKKNRHEFSAERVQRIAQNTNQKIREGDAVPFMRDHSKSSLDVQGHLEPPEGEDAVYTKIITKEDLPNPKHTHLIGKLGLFTESLVAKSKEAIKAIKDKTIKQISCGVDGIADVLVEVSSTPWPAIAGMSLYSRDVSDMEFSEIKLDEENPNNDRFYTMESALGLEKAATKKEEELSKLSNALSKVLIAIHLASEEELKGKNPIEESYNALEYFNMEVESLFELVEEDEEEDSNKALLPTSISTKGSPHKETPSNFSKKPKKSYINFSSR
jgi:hypothetical protein